MARDSAAVSVTTSGGTAGRTGSECSPLFYLVGFSWAELSKQKEKKNVLLRKVKDLGGKSCVVLDDKSKMNLKGLGTYGREDRGAREPGTVGGNRTEEPPRPRGEGSWERSMSNRGYIYFLNFAEGCAM